MKKHLLSILLAVVAGSAYAQAPIQISLNGHPECGFEKVLQKAGLAYPDLIQAYRNAAGSTTGTAAKGAAVVYDIPVVFHVVYSAANPQFNVADSVLINQIDVLNKAFRHRHADTANVRSMFKGLAGDAEIQFHLAAKDPAGAATSGITRTISTQAYFGTSSGDLDSLERIKHNNTGGKDAWPTNRYLNIWVANLSSSSGQLSVLGYGVPPLNPLPPNWDPAYGAELASLVDGVVLQPHAIGSNNPLAPALQGIYTQGRAAVHEVGHYLGLQHVFGGNGGGVGICGTIADDGIADTPEQSDYSFDANMGTSCPSATKNTCGVGTTGDLPDMWEDYMDYARDACQTLFTKGQVAIMRAVLANQRSGLTNPNATSINATASAPSFGLYPNPASGNISIQYAGNIDRLTVLNFLGQKINELNSSAANAKAYDVSSLPSGNYLMLIEVDGSQLSRKFTVR